MNLPGIEAVFYGAITKHGSRSKKSFNLSIDCGTLLRCCYGLGPAEIFLLQWRSTIPHILSSMVSILFEKKEWMARMNRSFVFCLVAE